MSEIKYSKEQLTLNNNLGHPLVAKVLACIGTTVVVNIEDWGDDDIVRNYEFPDNVTSIGVIGDDAIGAVIGAYMLNDNLILIADYGDDGTYEFNVNNSTDTIPLGIVKLDLLNDEQEVEVPPPLPELSQEQLVLIYETIQNERENTGNFIADGHGDEGLTDHYKSLQDVEYILNQLSGASE